MSNVKITVIGAGAIGTSIGLALKQAEDAPQLHVHDKEPEHTKQALKMGAFDKGHWNLINACDQADLIILAIPATQIKSTLTVIASELKEDAIVTDTAPFKQNTLREATAILPTNVHYVGGNPIVATLGHGPEYARANLFQDTLYCLTPTAAVHPDAVKLMEDLVRLLGALPFFLDPAEHDGLISGVNELPTLFSLALVHAVSQSNGWKEMRRLAGGAFLQAGANATGDPDALAAEFISNKDNLLRWIDTAANSLQLFRRQIESGQAEPLAQLIDQTVVAHTQWQKDFENKLLSDLTPETKEITETPNFIKQLFGFGRK